MWVTPIAGRGGAGPGLRGGQLLPCGEGWDKWGATVVCRGTSCACPCSLPAHVRRTWPREGRSGLGTPWKAPSGAEFQAALEWATLGPQPGPCFAQKPHTSAHTGNSTWPSHVLFSRRGGKKPVKSVTVLFFKQTLKCFLRGRESSRKGDKETCR